MEEKNKISQKVIFIIIVVSFIVILSILVAFVFFINNEKEKQQVIDEGAILMTYNSENAVLSINNAIPINDTMGVILDNPGQVFDFTVDVDLEDSDQIEYEIVILKDKDSTILDDDIRFYLERQERGSYVKVGDPTYYHPLEKKSRFSSPKGSMVIAKIKRNENSSDNYRLRMWLSDTSSPSSEVMQNYSVSISVYGQSS